MASAVIAKKDFNPEDEDLEELIEGWRTEVKQEGSNTTRWAKMIERYVAGHYPTHGLYAVLNVHNKGLSVKELPLFKEHLSQKPMGRVISINRNKERTEQ